MFAEVCGSLGNFSQSFQYGGYLLNQCIMAYVSTWFALFVNSPVPSASRNRAVSYQSVGVLLVVVVFQMLIRRFFIEFFKFGHCADDLATFDPEIQIFDSR